MFTGLRWGLHGLFAGILVLVLARSVVVGDATSVVAPAVALAVVYTLGGLVVRRRGLATGVWLAVLVVLWLWLCAFQPEGVYLVFPLFFLVLHLVRGVEGPVLVVGLTAAAVAVIGLHSGWSVGGVVGPVIGACVALLIGIGYRALAAEATDRERLLDELVTTRDRLVASERESATLDERARLARDIHDTVAQSLSSIQMLLHAAERADPDRPGVEHIRLARETAASSLVDTRGIIRALAPPELSGEHGLAGALERVADTAWRPAGLDVRIVAPDDLDLPMPIATAFLRIAQGAMANAVQHAGARHASVELSDDDGGFGLLVTDDGQGFDPAAVTWAAAGSSESFGLQAIRERVRALGGTLDLDAAPGRGTRLRVEVPHA